MAPIRAWRLLALAVATGLLAVAAWDAHNSLVAMRTQQKLLAKAQQRMQAARAQLPEIERREVYAKQIEQVAQQVSRSEFTPERWSERRLRRPLQAVPRTDAAQFLDDLSRAGAHNVLVADYFELAAVSKGAGLFQPPTTGDEGISIGITATQYFRSDKVNP
jgi:hypothetical protein